MNDHELRDAYEALLRASDSTSTRVSLPVERIESLIERKGDEAERLRSLDVLMSTAEGRRELEVAWAASRAATNAERKSFMTSTASRWLAAAAVLLITVSAASLWMNDAGERPAELLRGGESPVQLVSPGNDNVPSRNVDFTWRSVADAVVYTLIVVDSSGGDVYAGNTTDTSITLPDSISLRSGAQYLWWVQASMPDGSNMSAVTQRFRVR